MAVKQTLAVMGGVAILGAGAGAYVLTKTQMQASKPAVQAMQEPPPQALVRPAPLPDATAAGSASPQDVATLEFASLVQPFSLVRDSAAYVAASADAPQMYPLRAGTGLLSAERSQDGKWVIALTADGQAAYLPGADLGPYNPAAAPKAEPPPEVAGVAKVVDTATLEVDGQQVSLTGVKGRGEDYAQALQSVIDAQGPRVACALAGSGYTCKLPTGLDVARMALYNGGADVADEASDDYRQQAAAARTARRGIWK